MQEAPSSRSLFITEYKYLCFWSTFTTNHLAHVGPTDHTSWAKMWGTDQEDQAIQGISLDPSGFDCFSYVSRVHKIWGIMVSQLLQLLQENPSGTPIPEAITQRPLKLLIY